jgi:hypothetical protein
MPIELREFHQRQQKALRRHADTLGELYARLCELDAGVVRDDGTCSTCGRQVREVKPEHDFVQPPDMSDQQAEAQRQFWERRDRELREREEQAAAATTKKKPAAEEPKGRDFTKVLDSSGNVRY